MGHGSGGRLTAQLMRDLFLPAFDNPLLRKLDDQAVLDVGRARIAFTTDSFVVTPLFFPGGNIGELAVNGTVNDLAMSGAARSGSPRRSFWRKAWRWTNCARGGRVHGRRGARGRRGDRHRRHEGGEPPVRPTNYSSPRRASDWCRTASRSPLRMRRPGDVDHCERHDRGSRHGRALQARRAGAGRRDPLRHRAAAQAGRRRCWPPGEIHALRDPTRGGLGTSLCEIAAASGIGVEIDARSVPVREQVKGACETLGIDPLFVANEGKLVAFVDAGCADAVLEAMQATDRGPRRGRDRPRRSRIIPGWW